MTTSKTYINEFFRLKCAPDIMAQKVFPNAKEVTESMAAFNAVRKYLSDTFDFNDYDVNLYAVGDGCTPRTAALFAYRTKWGCHSIDPLMRDGRYKISRLFYRKDKIQDIQVLRNKAVIVCVHSHASMEDTLKSIQAPARAMVAIPCCKEYNSTVPCISYEDEGIWSPKRTVKIWKQI